jgi:hypothetical protein
LGVGEAAILQNLEQHVEDVRVGFLASIVIPASGMRSQGFQP